MKDKMIKLWMDHKKILLLCVAAVFAWGLAAHGYAMLNFQLSHDSLDGLYAAGRENAHKIELGRVLVPAYRTLFRGQFAMPWLTGLVALLWIALGAWMMVTALEIRSKWQIVLISGILTVNLSITALAGTFIHDWDQNMFGMMMACLAVLMWKKRLRGWFLVGMVASSICLGIYQAFISVAIGLIMILCMLRLIRGEKWLTVVWHAIQGALMVALGGVIFLGMVKAITAYSGVPLVERNNSLTMLKYLGLREIPGLVKGLYENFWDYFMQMPNTWLVPKAAGLINKAVMGVSAVLLTVNLLIRKRLPFMNVAGVLLIALLLPMGLNACYLLTSGFVHHLMQYAFVLLYILYLLLGAELHERHKVYYPQIICGALTAMILWSGVQTANTYHFQKTSSVMATNTRMINVYHDMLEEGYVPGQTPLAIIGETAVTIPEGFEQTAQIWPGWYPNAITSDQKSIRSYFSFVLGDAAVFCTGAEYTAVTKDLYVQNMPCYPYEGYVDWLDEVMVVKLY